jgi:hypothetical protein
MVKTKAKKQASTGKPKAKRQQVQGRQKRMGGIEAYMQLLSDPCAADFATPPYSSSDSGYLVRTVEVYNIQGGGYTGLTIGQSTIIDFTVQVTPLAYVTGSTNAGLCVYGVKPNNTITMQEIASTNFVVGNNAVRKFRPIAACLKVLPNGPMNTRQGTIALGYSCGQALTPGSTVGTATQISAMLMDTSPTGAKLHEIKWVPSNSDQVWSDPSVIENFTLSGGTVVAAGVAVDAVALSATLAQANVLIEITICWEWTPSWNNGIATIPRTPSPHTIQDVLSQIPDIGAFLLGTAARMGTRTFVEAATFGVRQIARRYSSVPLLGAA